MKRTLPIAKFLLVCAAITVIFGTIYAAIQQNIRQSANDPQIQMVEDAATALSNGAVPASVMPADRTVIDASTSLSPFIMVFDENGTLLESSMKVGDTLPVPPKGVFDFTRSNSGEVFSGPLAPISRLRMQFASNVRPAGEDRITWQTAGGLRFAAVVIHFSASSTSGFVLAGRSLREVENREGQLVWIVLAGWVVTLLIVCAIVFWDYALVRKE
jgi:hypothetical protein